MAPLLTEDKLLLLGFGNDELELDLLAQHGRAEGESMEGALRQLKASTHTRALVTQRVYQESRVKKVKDFQAFKHISRFGHMCMRLCDTKVCSPVQQGLPHSNADTVHSDERHCGPRTWSDVWTWSHAWRVFLHFADSLQIAKEN